MFPGSLDKDNDIMKTSKKFHLRIYEMSHYGDESEAYDFGEYATYEDASLKAQSIVDEFLVHTWKIGTSPEDLLVQFAFYGDDPVILPNEPGVLESFSATTYVKTAAADICSNLESKLSAEERIRHNELKLKNAKEKLIMQENLAPKVEEKKVATRSSWEIFPMDAVKQIDISLNFNQEQFEKIKRGFIPHQMEEKWFIFYENEWLYFHRSWTGIGMYKAQIKKLNSEYLINEFFVQSSSDKYVAGTDEHERQQVTELIDIYLLDAY